MKKKITIRENIGQLKRISSRIPKTINEAINFNEDYDDEMLDDEPMGAEMEEPAGPAKGPVEAEEPNIDQFIANMRKESLGIMKKLADDPDNAVYQFAKKIFQLADKAHEDQKEGKDINGQPKQQMMQQQPQQGSAM